jgi:predicted 3-demethylubiquinone-9 3-methyltransferase (glyoxalase superfamily)
MTSITPFLWFDNNVPEAVAFYKSVFPNAKVETVNDFMATFELEGQRFNALNGGPKYKFNEAISFFISVESQDGHNGRVQHHDAVFAIAGRVN